MWGHEREKKLFYGFVSRTYKRHRPDLELEVHRVAEPALRHDGRDQDPRIRAARVPAV